MRCFNLRIAVISFLSLFWSSLAFRSPHLLRLVPRSAWYSKEEAHLGWRILASSSGSKNIGSR